jgi:hypothetical protein
MGRFGSELYSLSETEHKNAYSSERGQKNAFCSGSTRLGEESKKGDHFTVFVMKKARKLQQR